MGVQSAQGELDNRRKDRVRKLVQSGDGEPGTGRNVAGVGVYKEEQCE